MRLSLSAVAALSLIATLVACAPAPVPSNMSQVNAPTSAPAGEEVDDQKAIGRVLDDWHDAAAKADEKRYFDHLTDEAVFLGTDITERWDKKAFRAYAHPHFEKGKAWKFRSVRRVITLSPSADSAWFDEDLETEKLGPARGTGALVRTSEGWKITLYNLSIPIPNERFDQVKKIIAGEPPADTGGGW